MAGRGCTITVQVLQTSNEVENLTLQVALHTPLSVLKEQLEDATGITVDTQILILCDLGDVDRNSDILLERLELTLRQCGIENDSVLTLHRLGSIAVGGSYTEEEEVHETIGTSSSQATTENPHAYSVEGRVPTDRADHSYNGLIFDIEVLDAYEVELTDVSIAGMLGHIRIYIRDKSWRIGRTARSSAHWWAHEESVSAEGWTCVVDKTYGASWDVATKVYIV